MGLAENCASDLDRLSEEEVAARLDSALRSAPPFAADRDLRSAAVLLPLLRHNDCWHVLFTRRTEIVQSHKGQVSFPGGGAEAQDASPVETALREAFEEIGLFPADVRILGQMPDMMTVSSFRVTPVVGIISRWPYEFIVSPDEVGRIFTIPLAWLAEPAHWEERPRINRLGLNEKVVYYQVYDGELLWGITARITIEFLRILQSL